MPYVSNRVHLMVAASIGAAAFLGSAAAQEALEARVVTNDGQPVANVEVVLENLSTGSRLEGRTDAQGRIRFGVVPTGGPYRLTADADAEVTASDDFYVRSGIDATVSVVVERGDADVITVTGVRSVARLNTSNAEISSTLTAAEIETIPVEARSLERLLFRLPSVTQSTGFFGEAPAVAINGANALFTNYTIDGLDNNENFLGGQRFPVPVGAVQDVSVLSSTYSVEFGRTANGVVNVTTPSGGNEFSGEAVYLTRPSDFLQSDPSSTRTSLFGAPVSDNFSRQQGAFSLSGPIVKDRTFFFANVEYVEDQTDNILSVSDETSGFAVNDTLEGTNTQLLFTTRIDHDWSDRWRSTFRVNYGDVELERQGGGLDGGSTFPSAGSVQDRESLNLAVINAYRGAAFDYVGSVQYSVFDWGFGEPLAGEGPQVSLFAQAPDGGIDSTRLIGTIGHPGFVFDERERTWQTQHKISFDRGAHRFKAGLDYIHADFELFGGGNVDGNFTVALTDSQIAALPQDAGLAVADLPAELTITNAAFEVQAQALGEVQRLFGFYVEDQWQVTGDLSVTLGLRYDYDTLTEFAGGDGDGDNFAPRIGFNYAPRADFALRGGVGLYVEKIPYAVISDAIQQNSASPAFAAQLEELQALGVIGAGIDVADLVTDRGNVTVDVTASCGDTLASCVAPGPEDALGLSFDERRIFTPGGLENPEALQASIGAEWQVRPLWYLGVDAQYTKGENLLRLVDLNAPAPYDFGPIVAALEGGEDPAPFVRSVAEADATRPTTGVRRIIISDTGGESEYRALILSARKDKGTDLYDGALFYTLSRLENDTDDINFRANDANDFAADFGPSLNDRTHVISALINLYPVRNLTVSAALLSQSGQPVNFQPDPAVFGTTDINGDGSGGFEVQFTGNPDRYPLVGRNSGRLDWETTVDLGIGYRVEAVPGGALDLRADFFNLFDEETETGFPVNFTASNQIQVFGQPQVTRSVGQPRTFQFTARYAF